MTTLEPLVIGDTVSVSPAFVDQLGAPFDPDAVYFEVTDPAHVQTTYTFGTDSEVTNPAVGTYTLTLPVTAPSGRWFWYLRGVGADPDPSKAAQGSWYVNAKPS